MGLLSSLSSTLAENILSRRSGLYVAYLRRRGVVVGAGTEFFGRVMIDLTRPCLVEIGSNCVICHGVQVLTHGYDWSVLKWKYGDVLCSSGKVTIEDNVFVGQCTIILQGTRVGRNTIVGAGSVVTKDVPPDSVAAGNPCRVIMSIDEYRQKRMREHVNEARAYALELYRKTGRVPRMKDFWEEFPLFLDRRAERDWGGLPVREQVGPALQSFLASKPLYSSFREFLIDAGVPPECVYHDEQA